MVKPLAGDSGVTLNGYIRTGNLTGTLFWAQIGLFFFRFEFSHLQSLDSIWLFLLFIWAEKFTVDSRFPQHTRFVLHFWWFSQMIAREKKKTRKTRELLRRGRRMRTKYLYSWRVVCVIYIEKSVPSPSWFYWMSFSLSSPDSPELLLLLLLCAL